jgi:hypothetical protein
MLGQYHLTSQYLECDVTRDDLTLKLIPSPGIA